MVVQSLVAARCKDGRGEGSGTSLAARTSRTTSSVLAYWPSFACAARMFVTWRQFVSTLIVFSIGMKETAHYRDEEGRRSQTSQRLAHSCLKDDIRFVHKKCGLSTVKPVENNTKSLSLLVKLLEWRIFVQTEKRFSTCPVDDSWVSVWTSDLRPNKTELSIKLVKN